MGGKVAMRAALEAPAAIARLVVADIAPVPNPPTWRGIAAAMAAIQLRAGLSRAEADAELAGAVAAPEVRAFLLQNLRFGGIPSWKIGLSDITAGLPDIEDWPVPDLPPYRGPVLVIAGERSDYIRAEHRPLFKALFPAARFATLKASGHWLHADNPDGFVALVEAFMA
jgi:pimeloyl-ACP methyl ester carboxylesterase